MTAQLPGPSAEGEDAASGSPRELDWQVLLEALAASGRLADPDADQETVLADELAAASDGRMSEPDLAWTAAVAVEHMDPGPAQAGWLETATAAAGLLDEDALAGVAIASQQAASHAHAAGLAAAAQISARAAAADARIGVETDGRPVRLCRDAQGQISLALMLTGYGAAAWADLGITLTWRLPATGKALAAGVIDLERARAIAEATSVLSEDTARAVEAEALPGAERRTTADLKARLRHLVIAADPDGAERRRQAAERHADVRLYGEVDQTATIVADKQPQIEAAAGFARLNAMARARKAAGFEGPLGWHRSQVLLGLLNGTLPPPHPPTAPHPTSPRPTTRPGRRARTALATAPACDDGPGAPGHAPRAPRTTAARGMTCPRRVMRTPPPTTAWTTPWTTPPRDGRWDPDEEDDDLAGTGPGRCGRNWARSRPPWPARPQCRLTVGRCPGCWM